MKLNEIKKLQGTIKLITGLHIGTGNMELHIGGTDSPIAKHPNTSMPYIPGSSLKGKIRSLLETNLLDLSKLATIAFRDAELNSREGQKIKPKYKSGDVVSIEILKFNEVEESDKKIITKILKLFGSSASNKSEDQKCLEKIGTTRLIFSDCYISDEWLSRNKDAILSEVKSENSLNRLTSSAKSPRFIERIPSGIEFDFSLSIKIFEGDNDEKELIDILKKGIQLLQKDYLGGNGSRGYGKIEFKNLKLDGNDF